MEKYAFFGGSFNPPTYAPLDIAKIALASLNLSKVLFVPAGNNYNKADLLDEKVRYEMLRLMCENEGNIYVENIELNRKKALRAHQALEEIDKKYNTSENCYIMGADNFVRLPNWDEAEEMLKKYNFIVFKRGEIDLEEQINDDELLKKYREHIKILMLKENNNCRSGIIRDLIEQQNYEEAKQYTKEKIVEYLKCVKGA